jgi:hypothetical protein
VVQAGEGAQLSLERAPVLERVSCSRMDTKRNRRKSGGMRYVRGGMIWMGGMERMGMGRRGGRTLWNSFGGLGGHTCMWCCKLIDACFKLRRLDRPFQA